MLHSPANPPLAVRLYRLGLRAYPVAFRQRHGTEMARNFSDDWRIARQAGAGAALAYAGHIFSDFARTAPPERLGAMTFDDWLALGTATFCGATAAWIDWQANEAQSTSLVLVAGAACFSYFAEKRTWRWSVAAAAWLPAAQVMAFALGLGRGASHMLTPSPVVLSGLAMWLVAFLAALTGVFVGTRFRRLLPPCACVSSLPASRGD